MTVEEMQEITERDFRSYGRSINLVPLFKYLGINITASENDWTVVGRNLRKTQKNWAWLKSILGWEGSITRVSGTLLKAVIQEVFLFGSEMWVMTHRMVWALGRFQNRAARQITGRQPQQLLGGIW